MPEDVLRAIMGHLASNEAVKLGTLHSALRRALGMLPSLQPFMPLDVWTSGGGVRTRSQQAAEQTRRRRDRSFAAFRAAHPGLVIEAMSLRLVLPEVVPRHVDDLHVEAGSMLRWLPLHSLRRLRFQIGGPQPDVVKVSAPVRAPSFAQLPCADVLVRSQRWLGACARGC